MIPGAYHLLHTGAAAAQARLFLQQVQGQGGPSGMLIALD